jgi:hypothetical protein
MLTQPRFLDRSLLFGCEVRVRDSNPTAKDRLMSSPAASLGERLPGRLRKLGRVALRAACRRHGLADCARVRADLQSALPMVPRLDPRKATLPPVPPRAENLLKKAQMVYARQRQWIVTDRVLAWTGEPPFLRLDCLDDDDTGNVAEKTVYTVAQAGGLPAFKVVGQSGFRRANLDGWMDAKTRRVGGQDEVWRN